MPALVGGHRPDVPADRVGHLELSHHLQLQDRRGRELLGHRHHVVDGVAPGGDPRLAVGHAEALAVDHLPVASGDQAAARAAGERVVEEPRDLLILGIAEPLGRVEVLLAAPTGGEQRSRRKSQTPGERSPRFTAHLTRARSIRGCIPSWSSGGRWRARRRVWQSQPPRSLAATSSPGCSAAHPPPSTLHARELLDLVAAHAASGQPVHGQRQRSEDA